MGQKPRKKGTRPVVVVQRETCQAPVRKSLIRMALWLDKHRPKRLSKLDYHKRQAEHLERLVKTGSGDFPHLLVYGPPGAGKKTRVVALLREMYGAGSERLRIEHQSFETPSKKKLEIVTVASNYHIEVNPSDVGIYDRIVIQELIKTVASAQQIHVRQPSDQSTSPTFKVVVLTEVDRLTKDAQHALRRTMEKYMSTCRIILMTNSTSKVIPRSFFDFGGDFNDDLGGIESLSELVVGFAGVGTDIMGFAVDDDKGDQVGIFKNNLVFSSFLDWLSILEPGNGWVRESLYSAGNSGSRSVDE